MRRAAKGRRHVLALGAVPLLAFTSALGLLLIAFANDAARSGAGAAEPLFWLGLIVIYGPIAFRLLSTSSPRAERIGLVVLLSISLFLVKVLYAPNGFVFYDELGWWRATHDLLGTGHPTASNPLVVTTPGFPGLDLLTAPLVALGRLSIFHAGTLVVGVVRTAFMLALFLFFERATRSSRAAGIGVAIYAANPSFLYFNGQFAYESLALLIGVTLLLTTVRWTEARRRTGAKSLVAAMALLSVTLAVTHHMTSYAILALLIGWAILAELQRLPGDDAERSLLYTPALPAIMLGIAVSAWFAFVAGGVTITELSGQLTGAISSAIDLLFGGSGPKKPFEAGGQANGWLARLIAVVSVLTLIAAIPFGVRKVWKSATKDALQGALALVAILYLATLGLRLTANGTEASQRASEFVFLGLAFLVALLIRDLRKPTRTRRRLGLTAGLAVLVTVLFLGGFIVGEPPQGRQPGAFLVSAERRSVSAEGIAAAKFAAAELPPESRILVDHANAMLMGSYGGLDPVTRKIFGVPVSKVFIDPTFDPRVRRLIRRGHIDYIVVDRRLSHTPPVGGYYFTAEEPGAFSRTRPIPASDLKKFAHVPGLTKIYGNGTIAIYDTAGIRR